MANTPTSTARDASKRVPTDLQMSGTTLTVGSLIMTADGDRLVEDLTPGTLVVTKDFGLQKLKYIAFQDVDLLSSPEMGPVKVSCRHLGFDRPSFFAADQRISIRNPMFDLMFGASEVLVQCGDLTNHPGFDVVPNLASLTYVALGFVRHHIISCNGAAIDIGPSDYKPSRMVLGPEEARLAMQLLEPKQPQAKHHSFPLH